MSGCSGHVPSALRRRISAAMAIRHGGKMLGPVPGFKPPARWPGAKEE
jgi:hypothetical protein